MKSPMEFMGIASLVIGTGIWTSGCHPRGHPLFPVSLLIGAEPISARDSVVNGTQYEEQLYTLNISMDEAIRRLDADPGLKSTFHSRIAQSNGRIYEDNGPRGTPGCFIFVSRGKASPSGETDSGAKNWTVLSLTAPMRT